MFNVTFSTYRQFADQCRRHAAGHRAGLPVLAASPRSVVNLVIIGHHCYVCQCFRTITYDIDILDGLCQFTILNQITGLHEESKVTGANLHLTIRKRIYENTVLYSRNNIRFLHISGFHIRGAHAGIADYGMYRDGRFP